MARLEIHEPAGRYADGAEQELYDLITSVDDRSVGSLALRGLVHDWPTHYHLSHRRGELLRPLQLAPGSRVLEIGAGAGAMTRWLGERGLEVVAVEGARARAEIAAARCADLDDVRVLCGSATDVVDEPPFDAVLLIGVVEYGGVGGFPEPEELLATAAGLVSPDGVLVMAIENQLGLEYLAGAPEDHRLSAWSGVEGYRRPGPRTWSRKVLRRMLADAGVAEQRWLFPFPDYKLPVAVLAEGGFDALAELGEGPGAVTTVARAMASPHHNGAWRYPYDLQLAHEAMVEAGLGPDVANSFLVVAGRTPDAVDEVADPDALAWILGDERRPGWIAPRAVVATPSGTVVRSLTGPIDRSDGWLAQSVDEESPYLTGTDLSRLAAAACFVHDGGGLDAVLRDWVAAVDRHITPSGAPATGDVPTEEVAARGGPDVEHPFAARPGETALEPDCLDIDLGNFIRRPEGSIERIDREWRTSGPVSRDLVMVRALWNFARGLTGRCITFPGAPDAAVDDIAVDLARRAGLRVVPNTLHRWREAERELQVVAIGARPDQSAGWLDGGLTVLRLAAEGQMPRTRAAELGLP